MNTSMINEIVICYPEGRLSNDKHKLLEIFLVRLLNENFNCDLIINMEDVPSISSGCIEVLVYISNVLRAVGRTLAVCRSRDLVRRILSCVSIADAIIMYETEDEAITALMPLMAEAYH